MIEPWLDQALMELAYKSGTAKSFYNKGVGSRLFDQSRY